MLPTCRTAAVQHLGCQQGSDSECFSWPAMSRLRNTCHNESSVLRSHLCLLLWVRGIKEGGRDWKRTTNSCAHAVRAHTQDAHLAPEQTALPKGMLASSSASTQPTIKSMLKDKPGFILLISYWFKGEKKSQKQQCVSLSLAAWLPFSPLLVCGSQPPALWNCKSLKNSAISSWAKATPTGVNSAFLWDCLSRGWMHSVLVSIYSSGMMSDGLI